MIRLEGDHLPLEARGAVPPILFGDLLQDVPGIPLQIGWTATLADNCGIDHTMTLLRLGGADLAETLAHVSPSGVVQIENEWLIYTAILPDPPQLVIALRGYGGTVAAPHDKGTTVYFVETKPIYVFASVPPGCTYPDDAVVQLRVNGNADVTPATVRLQDTRLVPGVRLLTVEFDASRAFYSAPIVPMPSYVTWGTTILPSMEPASSGPALPPPKPGQPPPPAEAHLRLGYNPALVPAPPPPRPTITLRSAALGTVTADLRGLRDTVAGRYSGVPLGPLVQPTAITRLLLEETYGEIDPAQYHAPTWATTAARQAERGIMWRLVWTGETFETFRTAAQLSGQADLYLDDEGRWRYAFRDPLAPAVATLTARELLEEPTLAWTAGRAVITELETAWGTGVQGGTFTLASPMQVRHGRNHGGVAFPYAATEAIARSLGAYQLTRRDRPRQSLTVRACHATLGLTLADKIHVDTPLLALYAEQRVPFEIVGITDRGDQRVFACLEADPLALELFGALIGTATVIGYIQPTTLTGTVTAIGLAAGSLTTRVLAGTATGTATAVGSLSLPVSLAGTLAGSGAATGTLTSTVTGPAFVNVVTFGDTDTTTPTVVSFTPGAGTNYTIVRYFGAGGFTQPATMACVPVGGGTTVNLAAIGSSFTGTMGGFLGMFGGVLLASTPYTVTVTWNGGGSAALTISAYSGVGSRGTPATANGPPANLSVSTGGPAGLIVDVGAGSTSSQNLVPGAGQTAEAAMSQDGSNNRYIRGSYKSGSGTVAMTWTSPVTNGAFGVALLP